MTFGPLRARRALVRGSVGRGIRTFARCPVRVPAQVGKPRRIRGWMGYRRLQYYSNDAVATVRRADYDYYTDSTATTMS